MTIFSINAVYTDRIARCNHPSHSIAIWLRCIALLLAIASLSACKKPEAQVMLEDYMDSMSNVLEVEIKPDLTTVIQELPAFPAKRDRIQPTTEIREGILDVWDFEQCGMMHLISERNSSLGKVMPPSQKMAYELRFMAVLQQCRQHLSELSKPDTSQQAFKKRLEEIYQIKRENLPAEIWNGIYSSEEISQHFALGKPPLPPDSKEQGHIQRAMARLHVLATLAEQNPLTLPDWLSEIEDTYYSLYSSEFGAQLLPAIRILTHTLEQTAQAIEARLQQKPFCHKGHRPRRADVLQNIFQKYYAGEVQPYMALIQREGKYWLEKHEQIMALLPATKAMRDYEQQVISLTAPDGLWQQWLRASKRHTLAWQEILGQCGMLPGQGSEQTN